MRGAIRAELRFRSAPMLRHDGLVLCWDLAPCLRAYSMELSEHHVQ